MLLTEKQLENFWSKVNKIPDGCWLWTGTLTPKGYGWLRINGKAYGAHRAIYQHYKGDIQKGLVLDHLCRTRNCVNYETHLEPVTNKENIIRGLVSRSSKPDQMHCRQNHLYDENNVRIEYLKNGSITKHCRTCDRQSNKSSYHRNKKLKAS